MLKPFKSYNGGKESDGTYQRIINIMPPHDIYVEPFCGNAAIFRLKKQAPFGSILIDLDSAVIDAWSKIISPGYILRNMDGILWLQRFKAIAPYLKKRGHSTLIYIDPPYPKCTRKSSNDLYHFEMSLELHELLLSTIIGIDANVVISSYPNLLYDFALSDWSSLTFQSTTRSGTATEKIWFNYPKPSILHDYKYLGDTFRERARIKGINLRTAAKFLRMPDMERNAIISHLKNENII